MEGALALLWPAGHLRSRCDNSHGVRHLQSLSERPSELRLCKRRECALSTRGRNNSARPVVFGRPWGWPASRDSSFPKEELGVSVVAHSSGLLSRLEALLAALVGSAWPVHVDCTIVADKMILCAQAAQIRRCCC